MYIVYYLFIFYFEKWVILNIHKFCIFHKKLKTCYYVLRFFKHKIFIKGNVPFFQFLLKKRQIGEIPKRKCAILYKQKKNRTEKCRLVCQTKYEVKGNKLQIVTDYDKHSHENKPSYTQKAIILTN